LSPNSNQLVLPTLATQPLPRHVRDLLQLTMKIASNALEGNVVNTVKDLEQMVLGQVERTMDGAERTALRQAVASLDNARPLLVANFMAALEAELALLQSPVVVRGQMTTRAPRRASELSLVNDHEIEETSALTDAATRAELQNSLPLFLLGQRFGVLAGRPAFDAETLPIGPQALCRSIRRAVERIELDVKIRLMMYRAFEKNVMRDYGSLLEQVNGDLARNGVLPNLQYVPVRARRTAQTADSARTGGAGDSKLKMDEASGPSAAAVAAEAAAGGTRPPRALPEGYQSPAE
jgi:hypothetical protein